MAIHHSWTMALARAVTVGAAALGIAGCLPSRPAGPRASFDAVTRDLGTMRTEEDGEARFPVRNTGGAPLRIERIDVDCGCTTPNYPESIPPGGSGEIRVHFKPQAGWSGSRSNKLVVHTNDPARPAATLTLTANLVPLLKLVPPSPLFVSFRPGEQVRKEVRLVPRQGVRFAVVSAASDSPWIRTSLQKQDGDREGGYRLEVRVGPRAEPGDFDAIVRIRTTSPDLPEAMLMVSAQARSGPIASPSKVEILSFSLKGEQKQLARVAVYTRSGSLKVLGVETGDPGLRAELVNRPGEPQAVLLRYAGGWKPGVVRTTVRVRTDDPAAPLLKIPFEATVY